MSLVKPCEAPATCTPAAAVRIRPTQTRPTPSRRCARRQAAHRCSQRSLIAAPLCRLRPASWIASANRHRCISKVAGVRKGTKLEADKIARGEMSAADLVPKERPKASERLAASTYKPVNSSHPRAEIPPAIQALQASVDKLGRVSIHALRGREERTTRRNVTRTMSSISRHEIV